MKKLLILLIFYTAVLEATSRDVIDDEMVTVTQKRDQISDLASSIQNAFKVTVNQECVTSACQGSDISQTDCSSICSYDKTKFGSVLVSAYKCLSSNFCGLDPRNVPIGNFDIPIAVPNYYGSCTFKGNDVRMSFNKLSTDKLIHSLSNSDPLYLVDIAFGIALTGDLNVACVPYPKPKSTPPQNRYCPQQKYTNIGQFITNEFNCSVVINHQPFHQETAFSSSVSISLVNTGMYILSYKPQFVTFIDQATTAPTVAFGGGIPAAYTPAIKRSIANIFKNYNVLNNIQNSFYSPLYGISTYFIQAKCSAC